MKFKLEKIFNCAKYSVESLLKVIAIIFSDYLLSSVLKSLPNTLHCLSDICTQVHNSTYICNNSNVLEQFLT